ncbi:gastrula zinc finger protein XlCGF26.1 isoform X9 [Manduca sexta]|uniref:gastrula zinc finger protein XlCGF26.1 isoform X9 n=1 Tax=Manduca sexta TaxID=7130 RepID=UPI00188F3135|nr:gastrula zinc finger protein XlCGF26.1 isoform X9 [Manduca sexta]
MDGKTSDWRPGPSVCRCCLAEGCYKDISTEYFWMGKREVYADMLSDTFSVSIAYSSAGGPNSHSRLICEPCISRLRDAADFKRQVQECERTFMQHLDPGSTSAANDIDIEAQPAGKEVKLEQVKLEKRFSDDDFDTADFGDEDDDDMDDQPLTKFATKVPKKEAVDFLDLIDNSQITVKRMSMSKSKAPPAKKVKVTKKEPAKPTASKAPIKVVKEKKKKEKGSEPYIVARRNAEIVLAYSTVYPFRLPEQNMTCVYCGESYEDPAMYRRHMDDDHQTFNTRMAFVHCNEGYIKSDCTNIICRICAEPFDTLEEIAAHLKTKHNKPIDLNVEIGMQPFKLRKDRMVCAICNFKSLGLRQLSRHTQSHFLRYTCESCGKSYATNTALKNHMRFSHIGDERICRKCKTTFNSLEAKRKHIQESRRCWSHLCMVCGDRFMTWNLKQAHLVEVHGTQKKDHICPECGEVFLCRKKYRVHFKIAHTDDNFMCSCCGLKFDTRRNLEEHRVSHTKEKLFPCTVCPKSFSRKKNLVQHMWIHSEYKRFECKSCNKQFNQRVSWKAHMRSYHPDSVAIDEGKNNNIKFFYSVLKTD